jgi:hypothetical protein
VRRKVITSRLYPISALQLIRARKECTYPCALKQQSGESTTSAATSQSTVNVPLAIPINQSRCDPARIRAGADQEDDDEQQRLKIEQRRLWPVRLRSFRSANLPCSGVDECSTLRFDQMQVATYSVDLVSNPIGLRLFDTAET